MELIPVVSSNIKAIGFQENVMMEHAENPHNVLRIQFFSDAVFDYLNVPKEVFISMMNDNSKGTFWHRKIKGKYVELKVK